VNIVSKNSTKPNFEDYIILLVDDNSSNLSVLSDYLEDCGFTTRVATDGKLALQRAQRIQPALILLDVMMPPGIDGFETCRRLKAEESTKDIPVIFMTALSSTEDKLKGFEVGGVDYITKPIQQQEVLARVTAQLRIRDLTLKLQKQNQENLVLNEQLRSENIRMEKANHMIMDSIQYAKRIQSSLLPDLTQVKFDLPNSFFLWMPRDVVSGDMLYVKLVADGLIIAVIDCTGHGVPGAFMTMIASTNLRRIIREENCHDPAEILKRLNFLIKTSLKQNTEYAKSNNGLDNGLDAAICFVKPHEKLLTFAGAKLPLYYIRNDFVTVIKGDKQSLGYKKSDLNFTFNNHIVNIEKSTSFYLSTDGFVDQLGGSKRLSFGKKRFKNWLLENSQQSFEQQSRTLLQAFNEYRGDNDRQDDVTVMGFGF